MFSSLELLFMFSDIQGSLYKRLEAKMPLNALDGATTNQSSATCDTSAADILVVWENAAHIGHHHKRPAHIRKRW